jgi:hypothetical protein
MVHERATLLDKKRLGKNQKARLANLSTLLDEAHYFQPPATPPTPVTGERADWQGNVYAAHSGKASTLREMRRGKRFGTGTIQAMRSRIQRTQRKTRTGGVK